MTNDEIQAYEAEQKAEGLRIDPAKAIVTFWWADPTDPYGLRPPPLCSGRVYFARNPDSFWVAFKDIPDETLAKIRARTDLVDPARARLEELGLIDDEGYAIRGYPWKPVF